MVFEKLIGSLANSYPYKESADNSVMEKELQQGIQYLNKRSEEIHGLTNQLSLINDEGFSTKPLDEATQRELQLIQTLKTSFDVKLTAYGTQYKNFMASYNNLTKMVTVCQEQCMRKYPAILGQPYAKNRQACQAGCQLKGPYSSKCQDRYQSSGSGMSCSAITSKGMCSGGSIMPGYGTAANDPNQKDPKYGNTFASGCCACGGGSGGPPKGLLQGTKITSCDDAYKPFGLSRTSGNYTITACKNAPYGQQSAIDAATLWQKYDALVTANTALMSLAKQIYAKIDKLSSMDSTIKKTMQDKEVMLKQQLAEFETTFANLKSMEGQATLTMSAVLEDIRLRNSASDLRFYPWALLAVSGVALAIYQLRKI